MNTYEHIEQIIKDRMIKAIKAAGPAGLTKAEIREIEFKAMDDGLRKLCAYWDDLIAYVEREEVA